MSPISQIMGQERFTNVQVLGGIFFSHCKHIEWPFEADFGILGT